MYLFPSVCAVPVGGLLHIQGFSRSQAKFRQGVLWAGLHGGLAYTSWQVSMYPTPSHSSCSQLVCLHKSWVLRGWLCHLSICVSWKFGLVSPSQHHTSFFAYPIYSLPSPQVLKPLYGVTLVKSWIIMKPLMRFISIIFATVMASYASFNSSLPNTKELRHPSASTLA